MFLFDFTALFTKVPVDNSVDIIFHKLEQDISLAKGTKLSPENIWNLLIACLNTTFLIFDGMIYTQVEGAAMGSPVSPIITNLYGLV